MSMLIYKNQRVNSVDASSWTTRSQLSHVRSHRIEFPINKKSLCAIYELTIVLCATNKLQYTRAIEHCVFVLYLYLLWLYAVSIDLKRQQRALNDLRTRQTIGDILYNESIWSM